MANPGNYRLLCSCSSDVLHADLSFTNIVAAWLAQFLYYATSHSDGITRVEKAKAVHTALDRWLIAD